MKDIAGGMYLVSDNKKSWMGENTNAYSDPNHCVFRAGNPCQKKSFIQV